MLYYFIKVIISSLIIVIISEVSKSNTFLASLLGSIPTISILAILWLFYDTGDIIKIQQLTTGILWLTIPSMVFFIAFPIFLKNDFNFFSSIFISVGLTFLSYNIFLIFLDRLGVNI